jgi:hypothetical protein
MSRYYRSHPYGATSSASSTSIASGPSIESEGTIYIFPSPPSGSASEAAGTPLARSTSSTFSTPSDYDFSSSSGSGSVSGGRSHRNSQSPQRPDLVATFVKEEAATYHLAHGDAVGSCTRNGMRDKLLSVFDINDSDGNGALQEARARFGRQLDIDPFREELLSLAGGRRLQTVAPGCARYRGSRPDLVRNCMSSSTAASACFHSQELGLDTPHPRIFIPLLSSIASLFRVDDSTLHLLTHSTTESVLFPGKSLLVEGELLGHVDATDKLHGIRRLMASKSNREVLREGCAVACEPSALPTSPFIAFPLLDLVESFIAILAGGRKALHELW